jgi:hypothetical protein
VMGGTWPWTLTFTPQVYLSGPARAVQRSTVEACTLRKDFAQKPAPVRMSWVTQGSAVRGLQIIISAYYVENEKAISCCAAFKQPNNFGVFPWLLSPNDHKFAHLSAISVHQKPLQMICHHLASAIAAARSLHPRTIKHDCCDPDPPHRRW